MIMRPSPFTLLCAAGLFAIFSSTISKSPALPLFASHLGADPSGVGFVAAVSAFTGIIVSIPAGILSDRWGRRRMLLASAVVFASAPFFYLLVANVWQLAAVRFYHGLATAIFIPVGTAMVSDLFHKERGEKIGWFSTSTLIGRFAAPAAGGSVLGALAFYPDISYKVVYLICGAGGAAVLLLVLKMPVEEAGIKKTREWRETFKAFKTAISHKGIIITSVVEAAILFAYGTFETFLPLYSKNSGLGAYEIGIFLSAQVITLALTKPAMGRFSDRHGRQPQIFAGALIGAACIGLLPFFKSFMPLLAISILFGLSLSIVTSATSALIADMSRREAHGSAMGILGSVMDIGHTAGPLVSGMIAAHYGFAPAFIGASGVLAAASFAFMFSVFKPGESGAGRFRS